MRSRRHRLVRLATQVIVTLALCLGLALVGVLAYQWYESARNQAQPTPPPKRTGLLVNDPRAFAGYTLIAPMTSPATYLIDMEGKVVRTWQSKATQATSAYLLANGHLLRVGSLPAEEGNFKGPGPGGWVQEFTWDGTLVWDFKLAGNKQLAHHDVTRLPNGNVLFIAWDKKTTAEAIAAGRRPELANKGFFLPDSLIEIQPTGKTTGKVVWEWHVWDHLIQDHDKSKANYGNVADHAELVDVNFGEDILTPVLASQAGMTALQSIGYVGGKVSGKKSPQLHADWTHFNAVAYHPELDQIAVTVHGFNEMWIIDHSTTTAQAAGHHGGKSGQGGDLLYRWGNPRAYRAGTRADQQLFAQHGGHWIPKGLPSAGHLLVFNNGGGRPDGHYSSVDEIALPVDAQGRYARRAGAAYGPAKPIWSYTAPDRTDFFSVIISGAQRLANGNTLICSGYNGTLFEVTANKEVVWKYVNPSQDKPAAGALSPPPLTPIDDSPPSFPLLPPSVQDRLQLTAAQKQPLEQLQKKIDAQLGKLLTGAQKQQFQEMQDGSGPGGPGGFAGAPQPGQIMTLFQQARLKLTAGQKQQLHQLQKQADGTLDHTLTPAQKKQLKEQANALDRGGANGPGAFPGFGPPGGGSLFRASRYAPDYLGLAGKDLTPGKTIPERAPTETK